MALLKRLVPALTAILVSACGVSSISDLGSTPQLAPSARTASEPGAAPPAQAPAGDQAAALRKVSLTYGALSDPKSGSYKIGPLDVVEITVFKAPELSRTFQVSEAGTINFPLAGEIEAGGKSAREIEALLIKKLGAKYLQNPQISVFVKEHNSQRVTVEGSVKKPGVIPMAGGLSLLQAVAQAGGLDEVAESTVVVFRVQDGKRYAVRYDVGDIRAGRSDDPQLHSGDVIVVPSSDFKQGFNTVLKLVPLATIVPLL
jgi:polysaccharide export outer membrane protein